MLHKAASSIGSTHETQSIRATTPRDATLLSHLPAPVSRSTFPLFHPLAMAELAATTQLFLSRPLRSCGLNAFVLVP